MIKKDRKKTLRMKFSKINKNFKRDFVTNEGYIRADDFF